MIYKEVINELNDKTVSGAEFVQAYKKIVKESFGLRDKVRDLMGQASLFRGFQKTLKELRLTPETLSLMSVYGAYDKANGVYSKPFSSEGKKDTAMCFLFNKTGLLSAAQALSPDGLKKSTVLGYDAKVASALKQAWSACEDKSDCLENGEYKPLDEAFVSSAWGDRDLNSYKEYKTKMLKYS